MDIIYKGLGCAQDWSRNLSAYYFEGDQACLTVHGCPSCLSGAPEIEPGAVVGISHCCLNIANVLESFSLRIERIILSGV